MKTMFLIVVCAFALLSPRAYGVDMSVNVQEISHVTSEEIGGLCDVWGWYDSQNDKYYALACNGGDTSQPLGLKIVDATDPANPSLIGTAAYGANPTAMDIKVVGDYAYVANRLNRNISQIWIYYLPDAVQYPENDPYRVLALDDEGSGSNIVPLHDCHTIFTNDQYLLINECNVTDDNFREVAIMSLENPGAPEFLALWDQSDFGADFRYFWPHSAYVRGTTAYLFTWYGGIYQVEFNGETGQIENWDWIWYHAERGDVANNYPYGDFHCDPWPDPPLSKRPFSHSGWLTDDGEYLLVSDEDPLGQENCQGNFAPLLRVFDVDDFGIPEAHPVNAFDIIWDAETQTDQYVTGVEHIDTWGDRTFCPTGDCIIPIRDQAEFPKPDWPKPNYFELGMHNVLVKGRLAFMSWWSRCLQILDITDINDMTHAGCLDHGTGADGDWAGEAYGVYPYSPDGYIYVSGNGLYICRYGYTGELTENTTWRGDIYVYDTFRVPSGITLRINAGTNIYLYKDAQIAVAGKLVASGTSSDSIRFIALGANPQPGDWRDIYVDQNAACSLSYCSITNATTGVEARNYSDVFISHSNISHNLNAGVYVYKADLITNNSRITDNGVYGIYGLYSSAKVNASRFVDNEDYDIYFSGGALSGDSTLLLYDTLINATTFFTRGIYLSGIDKARVNKCVVAKHRQTAITLSNSDAPIDSCSILCGLDANNAIGIYLDNYSTPRIRHCLIDSMFIGVRTLNAEPDMGTINDPGYSSIRYNPQLSQSYYIYHVKSAPWWDTLYAVYNYYFTGLPSPSRFYSQYAWTPIKYWPWLMRQPKLDITPELPLAFAAQQNYPNPFNSNTVISFALDQAGYTRIAIYNILGQRVVTLAAEEMEAGEHAIVWTGRNDSGEPVSSGIYFYVIEAGDRLETKKMTLLR